MRARTDGKRIGAQRTALAWAVSIGAHIVVVGLMLLVVRVVVPLADDAPIVTVRFDDPGLARPAEPAETAETASAMHTPPPPVIETPIPVAEAPAVAPPESAAPPPLPDLRPAPEVRIAPPPEVRFAGVGAGDARDIVYVVDGSGSMISSMPIVIEELARSLRRLEAIQSFQVVFFQNDGYVSFPHPAHADAAVPTARMVPARRAYIESAIGWAGRVRPSGRSNPIEALEVALSLRPDAVFLLTTDITGADAWDRSQRDAFFDRLDKLNPQTRSGARRVAIKTILFLDEDKSGIVREIGARFGGQDGFVQRSREDLGL